MYVGASFYPAKDYEICYSKSNAILSPVLSDSIICFMFSAGALFGAFVAYSR